MASLPCIPPGLHWSNLPMMQQQCSIPGNRFLTSFLFPLPLVRAAVATVHKHN